MQVDEPMDRMVEAEEDLSMTQLDIPRWKEYYNLTKPGLVYGNLLGVLAGYMLAVKVGGTTLLGSNSLLLFWTFIGIAAVIAGGTTLNNVYDRDIDRFMERTKTRAITNGRISPRAGTIFGLSLAIIGETILGLAVNILAAILALVGLIVYVLIYTAWTKRTTTLNTVIGGISGAMPPLVGYVAVANQLDITSWTFFIFMFLWQPAHFLALAMRRCEEYRRVQVPMLPVVAGFAMTKRQIFAYTITMVPVSLLLYFLGSAGWVYLSVAVALGAIYIGMALKGLRHQSHEEDVRWATKMFRYSIIYLSVIFMTIILDSMF